MKDWLVIGIVFMVCIVFWVVCCYVAFNLGVGHGKLEAVEEVTNKIDLLNPKNAEEFTKEMRNLHPSW